MENRILRLALVFFLVAVASVKAQGVSNPSTAHSAAQAESTADAPSSASQFDESPELPRSPSGAFVELDSWIYPAIEKLAGLGYIHAAFLGMRPWTRAECAAMVEEASAEIEPLGVSVPEQARGLFDALAREFRQEIDAIGTVQTKPAIGLQSLYTLSTGISGNPLDDSYHFGQTIINNFGRPYQEGFNNYTGFSGYALAWRFTVFMRAEYQHAPSAPAYPLAIRQQIATMDLNPLQPATPIATTNQFRLLDTYIALNLANWDLSFGKQSLWWGPGEGGALLFSDNAEPIYMFRASRIAPFTLPWIFHYMGPFKIDAFVGKLSGNDFPPRPVMHGEKVTFKPTPNLELGFSRTAEFGGVGRPITLGAIWKSYTLFTSGAGTPAHDNPGKRTGGFDMSYKVPYLRNWVTVYTDSLSDDDPSPLANPPRAAINPGIYIVRIPHLQKLDFRAEAVNTDPPTSNFGASGGHFVYWDSFYHDLYTNKGYLLGSWIGREGLGFQGWSTYWLTPKNTIQFGYRQAKISKDLIPSGETLNDASVKINWWTRDTINVTGIFQYEQWLAPFLAPGRQKNWTTSVEVTYWPTDLHH